MFIRGAIPARVSRRRVGRTHDLTVAARARVECEAHFSLARGGLRRYKMRPFTARIPQEKVQAAFIPTKER